MLRFVMSTAMRFLLLFFCFSLFLPLSYCEDEALAETEVEAGEVQLDEEEQASVEELQEAFRQSLLQVVLKGQILENNFNSENEQAYDSIMELVIARILPEMTMEEPVELIEFYRVMSAFETSHMKYFLPLLQNLLRKIQSQIISGEFEETELGMLNKNAELVRSIFRNMEDRLNDLEEPVTEVEGGETQSQDSSTRAESARIEDLISQNINAIIAMQKEISRLREDLKTQIQDSSSGVSNSVQERMERIIKSMERRQDKTLELLQVMVDRPTTSTQSEKLDEELEDQEFDEDLEERYADEGEEAVIADPTLLPPLRFEHMIYGSDRDGLRRLFNAGSPGAEGSESFDPRVYRVLQQNGGKWAGLLSDWSYRGIPTSLTAELGSAGVRIHLGRDVDAFRESVSSYEESVRLYLRDGGRQCLVDASGRVTLDMDIRSISCD